MSGILIFAGTTEGRKLSERLVQAGVTHTLCVATEYGEIVLKEHPLVMVHRGRMDREEIREFITTGKYMAVVDATHPYAEIITRNIKDAMEGLDIPYFRLKRELDVQTSYEKLRYFESNEACAEALKEKEGNILLTTGSKELGTYCASKDIKERLYVRVLPGLESISLCMDQGIAGKQILALQGPFSTQMNEAMLQQYEIKHLVTKESGKTGGYREKLEAAQKLGIPVYVIGHAKEEGESFEEVCRRLEAISGCNMKRKKEFVITLVGIGMGNKENLTTEVRRVIDGADILIGAERMLSGHMARLEKKAYYKAEQIIPYLEKMQEEDWEEEIRRVAILFSGDSGFYSGCQTLYKALLEEVEAERLSAGISILPGISSISYLAACTGESYQDAAICSMHGKTLINLAGKVRQEAKIFMLMSGLKDMKKLGEVLVKGGLEHCTVWAGYQLSYPEQQVWKLTPKECIELEQEGLYVCCILNPTAEGKVLTHGKADSEFIRDKVPMTKEEVREVSICKLKLGKGAVLYDIGSGTGSIAIEAAGLSDSIQVYAVEQKEEAIALIKANKEKFGLENIEVIHAKAPEGLEALSTPSHAFIGGSGGKMKEILSLLYQKNPHMRIVINAISMETICEIKEVLSLYPIEGEEVVQLQASRAKQVGGYHLMQAENPVWICSFSFRK